MNFRQTLATLSLSAAILAPGAASAATYDIDPAHTFVIFKAGHLGIGQAYGMFRKATGSFEPDAGKLSVVIDADSIYTANKKRDDHLKGPDFFNTKQFPKITFEATKVEKKGDGMTITGNLTMKGKTKKVTMKASKVGEGKDPWGNDRMGFEGTITVDRMDFGVDYMPEGLTKDVQLMIAVEGIKKK